MATFGFVFVLLACLELAVSLSTEQKAQIQAKFISVGEECVKDHPLSEEDIAALKQRKFPAGENAGCFSACFLRNIRFFDEKGNLSKESALEHTKEIFPDGDEVKKVEEFFDTCSKVNEATVSDGEKGCERAELLFKCFTDNLDKFDF
ncbi:hypothetical protein ACJJTC_009459 [Scirpophaga incertulas]